MNFQKIQQYLSVPRMNRYLLATGNSKTRAKKLYKANLKIIQSFHPVICTLEVIVRNRLNDVLSAHFTDPDWIINQKRGFMVHTSLTFRKKRTGRTLTNDFLKREVEKAESRLRKAGVATTSGKVLSEQTFGFWTDLFAVHHYKILAGKPIKIFGGLPAGYGRKEIADELNNIRKFRNRINHNEPVCFNGNAIDLTYANSVYNSMIHILTWIDPEIIEYISDINNVQKTIRFAQNV